MKAKWGDTSSEFPSSEYLSSQEDEKNFTDFIDSHSYLPRETSKNEVEERTSPSTVVEDLEEEVSSSIKEVMSEDETESNDDLQN
ncbi:unnamed protein product, partial [Ilex paraguariensis]